MIDIGTGSGAIAVTLSLELRRPVIATDLSFEALEIAKSNSVKLGANVDFLEADLLKPFADASADIVVSNPPYVALADRESLQREVRDWEPSLALFGGQSGMCVYQRLIPEAWQRVLKSGGILAIEIGSRTIRSRICLCQRLAQSATSSPTLAGIPRILLCEKP